MKGTFYVPPVDEKKITELVAAFAEEGLRVDYKWLSNGKPTESKDGSMPFFANGVTLSLSGFNFVRTFKNNGFLDSSHLRKEELDKVTKVMIEQKFMQPPEIFRGVFFSALHVVLVASIAIFKWNESYGHYLAGSLALSLLLLAVGFSIWYRQFKTGKPENAMAKKIMVAGVLLSAPSSLLHFVLYNEIRAKATYDALLDREAMASSRT